MVTQILAQIDPIALPIGNELSLGAVVSFVLWYIYNEYQKVKTDYKELQNKYDALLKDCHDKEMINLMNQNNHSRKIER